LRSTLLRMPLVPENPCKRCASKALSAHGERRNHARRQVCRAISDCGPKNSLERSVFKSQICEAPKLSSVKLSNSKVDFAKSRASRAGGVDGSFPLFGRLWLPHVGPHGQLSSQQHWAAVCNASGDLPHFASATDVPALQPTWAPAAAAITNQKKWDRGLMARSFRPRQKHLPRRDALLRVTF
jgi:hypothetical protein